MSVPARHRQTTSVIPPHERLPLPPPERVMGLTRAPASPGSPAGHELADAQPDQPTRDRRTHARADCCGPTAPACPDMQSRPRMIHRRVRPIGKPHRLSHPERRERARIQRCTGQWLSVIGGNTQNQRGVALEVRLVGLCRLGPRPVPQRCG